MTIEEFNNTGWTGNMKMKHNGIIKEIVSVDFEEKLIAFVDNTDEDLQWTRCENCELLIN